MVRQVVEAQKALDDYASRLGEFFSDLTALQSFDTAVELAEHLQFNQKQSQRRLWTGGQSPKQKKSNLSTVK